MSAINITEDEIKQVLKIILDNYLHIPLSIQRGDWPVEEFDGMDGDRVYEIIIYCINNFFLTGDDDGGTNLSYKFTYLLLTPSGMRFLEEWPPAGREYTKGPWETKHWNKVAKPYLEKIKNAKEDHETQGNYMGPGARDVMEENCIIEMLYDANYLTAKRRSNNGFTDIKLDVQGINIFSPITSPIDQARQILSEGHPEKAIIRAIEGGVIKRMKILAKDNSISLKNNNGSQKSAANINDDLKKELVYEKYWWSSISSLLILRNEYAHDRGDNLDKSIAKWMIDGAEIILNNIP